jgi:hypothetical protein
MKHLLNHDLCDLAMQLSDDVYGANGDLDDLEIKGRLIERIHDYTNYQYKNAGVIPVDHVASIIRSVWEHMDRSVMEEMGSTREQLPSVQEMTGIVAAKVKGLRLVASNAAVGEHGDMESPF